MAFDLSKRAVRPPSLLSSHLSLPQALDLANLTPRFQLIQCRNCMLFSLIEKGDRVSHVVTTDHCFVETVVYMYIPIRESGEGIIINDKS